MAYRYFGDVRMELDWFVATIEFEDMGTVVDRSGGMERVRHDYDVHQWSCDGTYMYPIRIMTWSNERVPLGAKIDVRTLQLLRTRCCPIDQLTDMTEGVE